MAIDVKVRIVAMKSLAYPIGQPPDRQDVSGMVQHDSIIGAKPLPT